MSRPKRPLDSIFYTTFKVAELFHVSPPTVVNWVNSGLLPAHRTPGGHRRFAPADVVRFAKENHLPVPPALEEPHVASSTPGVPPTFAPYLPLITSPVESEVLETTPGLSPQAFASLWSTTEPTHGEAAKTAPRVFLSYAQESDAHAEAVLRLANSLRAAGIDAWIDRYSPYPMEGWPRWMQLQMEAARHVLLVCTPTWTERFERDPADGRGVTWEGILARSWLYEQGGRNSNSKTFIPVWFDAGGKSSIPRALRELPGHDVSTPANVAALIRRLRGEGVTPVPPLGAHDGMPEAPGPREVLEALRLDREHRRVAGTPVIEIDRQIREAEAALNRQVGLLPGQVLIGRFRLEQRIGQGTYGTVWRAVELQRGRPVRTVAVKVLHAQHVENRTEVERFFRGARALARLEHPNIVRLHVPDGEEGGRYFYVMEYLDGGDLHEAVTKGTLPPRASRRVVLQAAEGIAAAHAAGIIHRDVKPQNILIGRDGAVRVADFDLARLPDSAAGNTRVVASWIYGAPELMRDAAAASARSDVYGLAMTACFCALGTALDDDILYSRETVLAPLPERLRAVLARGIARKPEERWPSVAAFADALRGCGEPQ